MTNFENNLDKRVEAIFIESKKILIKIANEINSSIQRDIKINVFQNLIAKLDETKLILDRLTDNLLACANKILDDFKIEVANITEPEKTNAINKLEDLLRSELQDLVKISLQHRLH